MEKAVLVGIHYSSQTKAQTKEFLDELAFLATTSGAKTLARFTQSMNVPHTTTFVGKGKLNEITHYSYLYTNLNPVNTFKFKSADPPSRREQGV